MCSPKLIVGAAVVLLVIALVVLLLPRGKSDAKAKRHVRDQMVYEMDVPSREAALPQPIIKRPAREYAKIPFVSSAAAIKPQTEHEIIGEEILEAAPEYIPPLLSPNTLDAVDQRISVAQGEEWGEPPKYVPKNGFYPAVPVGGMLDALEEVEEENKLFRYASPAKSLQAMDRYYHEGKNM